MLLETRYFISIRSLFKKDNCTLFSFMNNKGRELKFVLTPIRIYNHERVHLGLFRFNNTDTFLENKFCWDNFVGDVKYTYDINSGDMNVENILVNKEFQRAKYGSVLLNYAESDVKRVFSIKKFFAKINDEVSFNFFIQNGYLLDFKQSTNEVFCFYKEQM